MSARFGSVLDNYSSSGSLLLLRPTTPPQAQPIAASRVLFEGVMSLSEDTSVYASILL